MKAKKGRREKKRKKKEKPRRKVWNYDYEYGSLNFCMESNMGYGLLGFLV